MGCVFSEGGVWKNVWLFVRIMGYGGADGTSLGFGGSGYSGVAPSLLLDISHHLRHNLAMG